MDMENIGDILGKLSTDDMSSLRQAAQSILGNQEQEKKSNEGDNSPSMGDFLNPEMILKISSMMSMLNQSDSRADLICALKPLLSKGRQKRADEAMQMIKMFSIMPMLEQQFGLSSDNKNESGG